MARRGLLIGATIAGVVALGIAWHRSEPAGTAETDRTVRIVAEAVSWPRQDSATGLLNAVLATRAARSGGLNVIEAEDLEAEELADPLARLILHLHQDGGRSFWGDYIEPLDACYRAEFTYYGAYEDAPERIACPADLTPLPPRPVPTSPWLSAGSGDAGVPRAPVP